MGDRIDEQVGREWAKEAQQEREADVKKAGPLLNETQSKELQRFLERECGMKPDDAAHVRETIDHLAGVEGAKPMQVIKDSLEGYLPKPFLKNDNNFKPVAGMIGEAIGAREEKITAMHPERKPPAAAPASPRFKA